MKVSVRVIPRSSQKKIVQSDEGYKVYVHESATDGKANKAVCRLIANFFNVAPSTVHICVGAKQRNKIVEIEKE